jgi:hypothetical protein
MSTQHTQLTLKYMGASVYLPGGGSGFDVRNCECGYALARRITACVNACAGLSKARALLYSASPEG